ncbi:ABC transporter substrate-binding protein [Nonomuraea sp. NPDC051941]|uniref:ABC transporter substrate-binding protein n=1 Tax=Nonomuraea sp. NPDC051941 TaxID=3364373 RepID=UPI0037C7EE6B
MSETNSVPRRGRRRLALTLAALAVTLLTACAGNGPAGRKDPAGKGSPQAATARTVDPGKPVSDQHIPRLNVGIAGQVTVVDPAENIGAGGLFVNQLGLEPLLRINAEGKLQPWLATEWKQVGDTVYEYTLREGVRFWDGTELTSEDVKYSWDYLRATDSRRSAYFAPVDTVEAVGKYSVRVTLKQPDASWRYTPAMWYSVVFQKKFAEAAGDKFGRPGTLLVATGPWKFDSLNPATGMELSAHAGYWGGKPRVDRVSVKTFAEDNSMALALRAGQIDITPTVGGPTGFDAAAGGGTVTTVGTCATSLLSLPVQQAPWDDVHVRRAVAHAINRKDIVAATQGRAGGPVDTLMSPLLLRTLGSEKEVQAALDGVERYPYDLNAAKAELARSSVPNGFSFPFKTVASSASIAQVIAAQLKKIGINIEIKVLTDTAWFSELGAKNKPLTHFETGPCAPDPSWAALFLNTDKAGKPIGLNFAEYTSPEVKKLLADGLLEQDPKQRLTIYAKVLKHLGEDVPYVPLYAEGNTYASTKYDIVEFSSFWSNMPWVLDVVPR